MDLRLETPQLTTVKHPVSVSFLCPYYMREGSIRKDDRTIVSVSFNLPRLTVSGVFETGTNKMTNSIITFNFNQNTVRTQAIDGAAWFCLADCAKALGIRNASTSVKMSEAGVGKTYISHESGRKQITIINEPNLYRLIFRSNKPQAQAFADWVYEEVLPSIRKTGAYAVNGEVSVREHTRALPSGKREIVLSEKAKQEIGGIVKKCCAVAVREELSNPGAAEREAFNKYMLKYAEKISQTPLVDMKLSSREAKIIETIRRAYQFDDARFYSYALDFFPRAKTADA